MTHFVSAPLARPMGTAILIVFAITSLSACSGENSGDGGDSTRLDANSNGDLSLDLNAGDASEGDGDSREDSSDGLTSVDTIEGSTLGQDCAQENECDLGQYCVGANPAAGIPGYCTILCTEQSECDFPGDDLFCCSEYGAYRGCFREDFANSCGDGTGTQGDECDEGGQSDCDGSTHYCAQIYDDRVCTQFCDTEALPGEPDRCPTGTWCLDTSGQGNGVCIPGGETENGGSCAEDPSSCEPGLICDGAFQDPPVPTAFCAALCE
ncbi:MAG: hypothetical protein KC561_07095, partial [Myxococcales bacterium]|nr:hypothetical protein [Myxococcales bacterium]